MGTTKTITLRTYTVHGVDLREEKSTFEDFIVIDVDSVPTNFDYQRDYFGYISKIYARKGYEVTDITLENTFIKEIDLFGFYLSIRGED